MKDALQTRPAPRQEKRLWRIYASPVTLPGLLFVGLAAGCGTDSPPPHPTGDGGQVAASPWVSTLAARPAKDAVSLFPSDELPSAIKPFGDTPLVTSDGLNADVIQNVLERESDFDRAMERLRDDYATDRSAQQERRIALEALHSLRLADGAAPLARIRVQCSPRLCLAAFSADGTAIDTLVSALTAPVALKMLGSQLVQVPNSRGNGNDYRLGYSHDPAWSRLDVLGDNDDGG